MKRTDRWANKTVQISNYSGIVMDWKMKNAWDTHLLLHIRTISTIKVCHIFSLVRDSIKLGFKIREIVKSSRASFATGKKRNYIFIIKYVNIRDNKSWNEMKTWQKCLTSAYWALKYYILWYSLSLHFNHFNFLHSNNSELLIHLPQI